MGQQWLPGADLIEATGKACATVECKCGRVAIAGDEENRKEEQQEGGEEGTHRSGQQGQAAHEALPACPQVRTQLPKLMVKLRENALKYALN